MKQTINERIENLREWMRANGFSAFVFPSSDPHNSEYVADHWKSREWISGFTGSAGTAVVTLDRAALWTDSRYFIAAAEQLAGTEYRLMKLRVAGTPTGWAGRAGARAAGGRAAHGERARSAENGPEARGPAGVRRPLPRRQLG